MNINHTLFIKRLPEMYEMHCIYIIPISLGLRRESSPVTSGHSLNHLTTNIQEYSVSLSVGLPDVGGPHFKDIWTVEIGALYHL